MKPIAFTGTSAVGLLRLFARGCFPCANAERRGRRHPAGAHAVAVAAARRLRCDARSGLAPQNSLRELRSLRSDSRGESDERSALRAPSPALRLWLRLTSASRLLPYAATSLSSPQKSPPPGTACRAVTLVVFAGNTSPVSAKVRAGSGQRASAQPRSAGLVDRARSALRFLTRRGCLNAANEVSVVSSATGPRDRASQGTLAQRGQAAARWPLPARAFARADLRTQSGPSRTTATDQWLR